MQYWVRANRQAVKDAKKFGVDFMIVDFDRLCREPHSGVEALLDFIGAPCQSPEKLTNLVRTPQTIGRRRNFDLNFVTDDDRKALIEFGFEP